MDIWKALREKNVAEVTAMLSGGKADPNEVGAGEQQPLHLAAELDDAASVAVLLKNGALLGAEDGQLRTPLLLACESQAFTAAQALIDAGAPLAVVDKSDMTPMHWLAFHGSKPMLLKALAKGAEVEVTNYANQTPLWFAIKNEQFAAAFALLDAGARADALDDSKRTMIHLSMQFGGEGQEQSGESLTLLKQLLKRASAELVNAGDREKRTALHWAVGKNALPCVAALVEAGANVNAKDWSDHTPLHWAMPMDAVDSASVLLKAGAKVQCVDRDKRTPLHWASEKSAEKSLRLLLEAGAEVDAVDWGGYSALHSAARCGSIGCIPILLEKGANPHLVANNGETPLDLAEDEETKKALQPSVGAVRKRKRDLSASSAMVEAMLPEKADHFYKVAAKGDLAAVRSLCTTEAARSAAAQVANVLSSKVRVGEMHVSGRTMSVHVELRLDTSRALHHLQFNDDGLIESSELYSEIPTDFSPQPSVTAGRANPPSG